MYKYKYNSNHIWGKPHDDGYKQLAEYTPVLTPEAKTEIQQELDRISKKLKSKGITL